MLPHRLSYIELKAEDKEELEAVQRERAQQLKTHVNQGAQTAPSDKAAREARIGLSSKR